MSERRGWSAGAKVFTASAVGMLLSFGLCGMGTGFEGGGTPLQQSFTQAGMLLLIASVVLFFVGILMSVFRGR